MALSLLQGRTFALPVYLKVFRSASKLVKLLDGQRTLAAGPLSALLSWDADVSTLHISFYWDGGEGLLPYDLLREVEPSWLEHFKRDAVVPSGIADAFQGLLNAKLMEEIQKKTMDRGRPAVVRRIVTEGIKLGGSVAVLAAAWAAVTFPYADTRCTSFETPHMNSENFRTIFQYLVGNHYCLDYPDDCGDEGKLRKRLEVLAQQDKVEAQAQCEAARIMMPRSNGALPPPSKITHHEVVRERVGTWLSTNAGLGWVASSAIWLATGILTNTTRSTMKATEKVGINDPDKVRPSTELLSEKRLENHILRGKVVQGMLGAVASYLDCEGFKQVAQAENIAFVWDLKQSQTKVFVVWLNTGTMVVAFRGTEPSNLNNWLVDFNAIHPVQCDWLKSSPLSSGHEILVHKGFLDGFNEVREMFDVAMGPPGARKESSTITQLRRVMQDRIPTRIVCCGHSLGGALATVAAPWFAQTYPEAEVRCITGGSPRAGNKGFYDAFQLLVGAKYRVIDSRDLVPFVPTQDMGYLHVQNPLLVQPIPPPLAVGNPSWASLAIVPLYYIIGIRSIVRNLAKDEVYYDVIKNEFPPGTKYEAWTMDCAVTYNLVDHFQWKYAWAIDLALADETPGVPQDADKAYNRIGSGKVTSS
eukprot:SM000027S09667  [mRNA]  locus=s27:665081:669738:- [translate_table: standard]